jgi:hypothetical protein
MTQQHDHDTVVVTEDRGGSSMGLILGIIGVVILIAAVWYFAMGPGSTPSSTTNNDNDTIINPPAASLPAVPEGSSAP